MTPSDPALYLSRAEVIQSLKKSAESREGWELEAAELLAHASAERLSPAALAALAAARHRLEVATRALQELDQAQLVLAAALAGCC